MVRAIILPAAALLWAAAPAQLTPAERDGLTSALFLRNLTLRDLDYVRRDSGGPSPLPAAEQAIDHPLEGADALLRLHASAAGGSLADLLARAQAQLRVPLGDASDLPPASLPPAVPAPLRAPVGKIVAAIHAANDEIRSALAGLTAIERRTLIDSLPAIASERRIAFDFVKSPPAARSTVFALLAKVDLVRIEGAASVLAYRVEREMPFLRTVAPAAIPAPLTFEADDVPVELSGVGAVAHTGRAGGLCLALGGDNHFTGRYGAGVGAASVLIDLGAGAVYEAPDLSAGAGLLGVGLVYEFAASARFVGGSLDFGAGLAGVGALYREGTDGDLTAAALGEGYGYRGIGLTCQAGGRSRYHLTGWGQGAGADGGLGWLVDRGGHGTFLADGFGDGADAQGFGRAGIGLLSAFGGAGTYRTTLRGQGVGERLGVGSLCAAGGHDVFLADASAQGFASDTGAGMLFELGGDSQFIVRGGACHGTAQTRSVAMLLSRAGNGFFASGDGRPGLATDGGTGIFLSSQGANRYLSSPGGSVPGRYGDALGLFVDMGGDNVYADGLDGGQARVEMDGAVAYDVGNAENIPPPPGLGVLPRTPAGGPPAADAAEIDALADEGTAAAGNRLVAIGAAAYVRLMQRPIAGLSPPIMNALVRLGHLLRQNAFAAVVAKLDGADAGEQRRALYLAATLGVGAAAPRVERLLQNPETRREAAEAAGLLRVHSAVPTLMMLTGSPDPSLALEAMLALERIGDEAAIPSAQALVASAVFPIRQSALRLLAHFTASGSVTAQRLVADPDERLRRIGIELFGRIGTDESLALAAQFLTSPSPGLRIQAMLAIDGRCPPAMRTTLGALRFDPNPAVRAVAARIDPGR